MFPTFGQVDSFPIVFEDNAFTRSELNLISFRRQPVPL